MNGSGGLQTLCQLDIIHKTIYLIHLFIEQKMVNLIETAKFADVGCTSSFIDTQALSWLHHTTQKK